MDKLHLLLKLNQTVLLQRESENNVFSLFVQQCMYQSNEITSKKWIDYSNLISVIFIFYQCFIVGMLESVLKCKQCITHRLICIRLSFSSTGMGASVAYLVWHLMSGQRVLTAWVQIPLCSENVSRFSFLQLHSALCLHLNPIRTKSGDAEAPLRHPSMLTSRLPRHHDFDWVTLSVYFRV